MKYSTLLRYVTPDRRTLLLIFTVLLAGSIVSLTHPWIAGQLTEHLVEGADTLFPSVQWILLTWLGLVTLHALLSFATEYLIGNTGEVMAAGLRSRVYEHMQILPLSYHHEQRPC